MFFITSNRITASAVLHTEVTSKLLCVRARYDSQRNLIVKVGSLSFFE